MNTALIRATPWDAAAFGMHTAEIIEYGEALLQQALQTPGHYTIKVDPLADKALLQEYGFYYCDTLLEPYCVPQRLAQASHPDAAITRAAGWEELLPICHGAFAYGRFHRDFNLERAAADRRYDNWLRQFFEQGCVYGLLWQNVLAGFIAYSGNNLALHAVAVPYRGKGCAKYWWRMVCDELFAAGRNEIRSSISASNAAALNLYASLGFSFRNPRDVYHRLVK